MRKYLLIAPLFITNVATAALIQPTQFQCCSGCTAGDALLCKTKCPNCPTQVCCSGCTATSGLCDVQCPSCNSADCTKVNVFCSAGQYCNTSTKKCTDCPTPGTSDGGMGTLLPKTKCYIAKGDTFFDISGRGTYDDKCYHDGDDDTLIGIGGSVTDRPELTLP